MIFVATEADRLLAPQAPPTLASRLRFAGFFLFFTLLTTAALFMLYEFTDFNPDQFEQPQETPVEIVIEPPPPLPELAEPEPPPPLRRETPELDEKPATDAPRAANQEKIKRDAPDEATKAPRPTPPAKQDEAKLTPERAEKPKQVDTPPPPAPPVEEREQGDEVPRDLLKKPSEEKPDPSPKQETKTESPDAKNQPKIDAKTMAQMTDSFNNSPDFKVGAAAPPTPVSGGAAKPTYLAILYGMIVPHMRIPPEAHTSILRREGMIVFYLDPTGRLLHLEVYKTSGSQALDRAAIAAIRAGSPFPPPPTGSTMAITYTFSEKGE